MSPHLLCGLDQENINQIGAGSNLLTQGDCVMKF